MKSRAIWGAASLLLLLGVATAQDAGKSSQPAKLSVSAILSEHDRALMRDLKAYVEANPKADDIEQAYMTLFERAIENEWFAQTEAVAKGYLASHPEGAVRPLARIVATMARANAGKFDEAWASYRDLMRGLDKDDQEEFASSFADTLAGAASAAGEFEIARNVYEALLQQFGNSPTLSQKVKGELARLEMVGKPAPSTAVRDLDGKAWRAADQPGKFILVDFWATWCAPCVADLPSLKAAYAKYHAKGFEVVSVSLDESPQPVVDFVKARKLPWRQVHNATCGGDLVEAFGVGNIPASFLIGPDGKVVRLELHGAGLEKALAALIK